VAQPATTIAASSAVIPPLRDGVILITLRGGSRSAPLWKACFRRYQ